MERPRTKGKGVFSAFRLAVRMGGKAILARLFSRSANAAPLICDVLLVHPSRKSYLQGRKRLFIEALRQRGLHVEEFIEEGDGETLRLRQLVKPPQAVPFLLSWPAAHAAFLLHRYQPKAMLTERNSWIIPSFVKAFSQRRTVVMHLAHSIPSTQSSNYDYVDYDYYLMYGHSSLEYLRTLGKGFGECTALFAGPYFLEDTVPPTTSSAGQQLRCLFLGSGPEYETKTNYLEMCAWVRQWAMANSVRLSVKPHPRAEGYPWRGDRVAEMVDRSLQLDEVREYFDLVLCGYTNAVLDVARAGLPFVLLGKGRDYFQTERFDLCRANSMTELDEACRVIRADPCSYRERLDCFLRFHIENPYQPCSSLVENVCRVVDGQRLLGIELVMNEER